MLRLFSVLVVVAFTLVLFISVSHAVDTNLKVGKYRVGINYSPLSACAVWDTADGYISRAANEAEYLDLSSKVFGLSMDDTVVSLEKITATRKLTDQEKVLCNELIVLDKTILKAVPSKSGTRRTKDMTATTYTTMRVPDTVLCEGEIIKKYQKNRNWYKVKDLNVTTLCGEY